MPTLTNEDRLGTTIGGRYSVEKLLGQGGMGAVFEAQHTFTGRRVALKLLLPEYATHENAVSRFMQEARAATAINHPNIVQVLDMGVDDPTKTLFLVLEYLEGEDLQGLLKRRGTLSPEEAVGILLPVMEGLAAAHGKGIVHRDLKPGNIFLARQEDDSVVPKLLDFGISKVTGAGKMTHTATGNVLGTPLYMSPEQARGEKDIDAQTDVWAMGVVLYECVANAYPFDADNYNEMIVRLITTEGTLLSSAAPALPAPFCDLVQRALLKDRASRYASMADFARAAAAWANLPTRLSLEAKGPQNTGPFPSLSSGATVRVTGVPNAPVTPAPVPSVPPPSESPLATSATLSASGMVWQSPAPREPAPGATNRQRALVPALVLGALLLATPLFFLLRGRGTADTAAASPNTAVAASPPPAAAPPTAPPTPAPQALAAPAEQSASGSAAPSAPAGTGTNGRGGTSGRGGRRGGGGGGPAFGRWLNRTFGGH